MIVHGPPNESVDLVFLADVAAEACTVQAGLAQLRGDLLAKLSAAARDVHGRAQLAQSCGDGPAQVRPAACHYGDTPVEVEPVENADS